MSPSDRAVEDIAQALREEVGDQPRVPQLAEALHAIATRFDVRIDEDLIVWIHCRLPDKAWSELEFRRWCEKFVQARAALQRMNETEDMQKLCPMCLDQFAQRTQDNRWWCNRCGVVE